MSFWWDPKNRKPQIWTYPIMLLVPVLIFAALVVYVNAKMAGRP